MSTKTKKRQSSAPRGSHYSEGKLVDDKTNQKLFFHTHVCTVFRETVAENGTFNKTEAIKVMEKNLKKRQAHGTACILEDRFTIEKSKSAGKSPFRTWLFYKEIVDIQPSPTKPEYFVLLVNSIISGRRYFEVYKCKNKEDAVKFRGFVDKARSHPEYVISDGSPLDVVPVPDPSRVRSMANIDFQVSIESGEEHERPQSMFQTTSPTPPAGFDYDDELSEVVNGRQIQAVNARTVRSMPMPEVEVLAYAAPPFSSADASPVLRNGTVDLEDVTYINYNPKRGAYACTDGPVYLYASRVENTYSSNNNDDQFNGHY